MLEIAIPTFNRAEKLTQRLKELLPQLAADTRVVIYDNGSTDETANSIAPYLSNRVAQVRWPKNRGMCRNFMRVFEEMNAEWVWMLSDDDPVRPDAVARIVEQARLKQNGVLVFKAQGNSVSREGSYADLDGFLREQHVMNLSYISGMVFHRGAVEDGLSVLAPAAYTLIPHALLALAALAKGHPIHTVAQEIVAPEAGEHRVSRREFLLGLAAFPEFFPQAHQRREIARQLRASSRWMIFSALAQVGSSEDLKRWRSMVAVAEASFAAHGAGWRHGALCTRWHSRADLRRELLLPVLRRLPDWALLKLSRILANKTHQNHAITQRDAQI